MAARDSYASAPAKCAAYFSQQCRRRGSRERERVRAGRQLLSCPCQSFFIFFSGRVSVFFNAFRSSVAAAAVMCCKIPLSACFEYSRNISLSCCCSSHSAQLSFFFVFFLHCFFYNTFFFFIFFSLRGILRELTQLIYMLPTVRSRASSSIYSQTYARKYVFVYACVCV